MRELLIGKMRSVVHVTRFAGQRVHRYENVAEHSYLVAQNALFIALDLIENSGAALSIGHLLVGALVHDLDEAIMVDLPRPVKYGSPELLEAWKDLCEDAVHKMESDVGVPFAKFWKRAKDQDTIEGTIVSIADFITVFSYLIEEISMGNRFMVPVLQQSIAYVEEYLSTATLHPQLRNYAIQAIALATCYVPSPNDFDTSSHRRAPLLSDGRAG